MPPSDFAGPGHLVPSADALRAPGGTPGWPPAVAGWTGRAAPRCDCRGRRRLCDHHGQAQRNHGGDEKPRVTCASLGSVHRALLWRCVRRLLSGGPQGLSLARYGRARQPLGPVTPPRASRVRSPTQYGSMRRRFRFTPTRSTGGANLNRDPYRTGMALYRCHF
jgi:hypothetical protein